MIRKERLLPDHTAGGDHPRRSSVSGCARWWAAPSGPALAVRDLHRLRQLRDDTVRPMLLTWPRPPIGPDRGEAGRPNRWTSATCLSLTGNGMTLPPRRSKSFERYSFRAFVLPSHCGHGHGRTAGLPLLKRSDHPVPLDRDEVRKSWTAADVCSRWPTLSSPLTLQNQDRANIPPRHQHRLPPLGPELTCKK